MEKPYTTLSQERVLLLGVTTLLLILFGRLYLNLGPRLDQAEQDYAQGRAINLRAGMNPDSLRRILASGNYFTDEKDLDLVTDSLVAEVQEAGALDNLGAINKRAFAVVVPTAVQSPVGGEAFQGSVEASRQRLGFDSTLYQQELNNPPLLPEKLTIGNGPYQIEGKIETAETGRPVAAALVVLQVHGTSALEDTAREHLHYARTDPAGYFSFTGLMPDSGYSVLPLKPGLEFGSRRGTDSLGRSLSFTFKARPHKIRLIGSVPYGQLKEDRAFTVRRPEEFKESFIVILALLLGSFWGVHVFWSVRRFQHDAFILPVLLLLVGLSLLTLLAIQNPLQDTLHAYPMAWRGAVGLVGMAAVSQLNIGKLYTNWRYDFLFNFRKRRTYRLTGWTWLAAALALAMLTLLFGEGPEGSGVKVNLNLGFMFQPSEVTKYLLLLFLAGFFAANEERIRQLSDARWRFRVSLGVLIGTGVLMLLYLLLGDMGPALVICFTFLIFYSIARGNLFVTLSTGALYGLLLYLLPAGLATVVSAGAAVAYMVFQKNFQTTKWYGWLVLFTEAPIILILIIAAFAFGDQIPAVGDRLAHRKDMWLNAWNNDVYGGDHLAHGFWSLASGGFSGQGLGQGFANTMPAAHTDMILPSIGEELGWMGLVAIFLLFGMLIHRIFLIARRAGQPFSFYLGAGIGIATGVQFLLIAGGSMGLLPLTGVSVPFLSFGSTALALNLVVMGAVVGISNRPGEAVQQAYIKAHYDPVIATGIVGFLAGMLILVANLTWVQLWSGKELIVKPARVTNQMGVPVHSYNPRIEILTRALAAGNIYDRNGLLLATTEPGLVAENLGSLAGAGLERGQLERLSRKRLRRYYPFAEQMFFWVGDANTRLFWDQKVGYFAESAHLSQLRGFDNQPRKSVVVSSKFQNDRFSKPIKRSFDMVACDYSPLARMLRQGVDGEEAAALKAKNRDIKLSVDAALQTDLQNALARSNQRGKRVSVVVLDAATGDVLASALNPLPNLASPEVMLLSDEQRFKLPYPVTNLDLGMTYATAPGSTAKILTASAAFNKLGRAAADITYRDIKLKHIIRADEPHDRDVNMKTAIVESSNIYFIRIANENDLDNEMADLYFATGMNVAMNGGYSYTPYLPDNKRQQYLKLWQHSSFDVNRQANKVWTGSKQNYNGGLSGLAWGQGKLTSTPVSMARMAGSVANGGVLTPSRYVLEMGGIPQPLQKGITTLRESANAATLTSFMIEQSNVGGQSKISGSRVAGKTGTAQRVDKYAKNQEDEKYDGWYVFFAPKPGGNTHTVVCVRIEWGMSSGKAVQLANEHLAPVLQRRGYLGSF